MSKRIGPSMKVALAYIARNPGCCAADVDRAVRTARNGHKWMYATIIRLEDAGLIVRTPAKGGRIELSIHKLNA